MKRTGIRYAVFTAFVALALAACAKEEAPQATAAEETLTAALWELAAGAETAADYRTAASHYERLHSRLPDSEKALLGYARNLRYLGLPKEAIKIVRTEMTKGGNNVDLKVELGKLQVAAAMLNDARETFERIISDGTNRWDVYSSLGIIYDRLEQFEKAREVYGEALRLSPENVSVRNNLALSLAQTGRIDEAITILEDIIASEFATPQTRQNLSMLYAMTGELAKAEELARQDLPPDIVQNNMATFHAINLPNGPTGAIQAPTPARIELLPPPAFGEANPNASVTGRTLEESPGVAHPEDAEAAPEEVSSAPRPHSQPVYVSIGPANVRNGPTTKAEPVAFLQKDDRVRVLGKSSNDKWYYIALEDGRQGYVYHNLIRRR